MRGLKFALTLSIAKHFKFNSPTKTLKQYEHLTTNYQPMQPGHVVFVKKNRKGTS